METLYTISIWLLPVLFAITFHEAAHGYVAWKLGDDTAYSEGRVSFDPLRHVDMYGTVLVPAMLLLVKAPFLFGWAKPVPVNFSNLNRPRRDMVLVAAAGPGVNIVLALAAGLLAHLVPLMPQAIAPWLAANIENAILINLILAVFNLLPIPPLDGGRIAVGLLPYGPAMILARLERFGLIIVILLILLVPYLARQSGVGFDPLTYLIWIPVDFLSGLVLTITGHG